MIRSIDILYHWCISLTKGHVTTEKPRYHTLLRVPYQYVLVSNVLGKSVSSVSPRSTRNAPRQWADIPDIPAKLPKIPGTLHVVI